jgi:hypothetical protein
LAYLGGLKLLLLMRMAPMHYAWQMHQMGTVNLYWYLKSSEAAKTVRLPAVSLVKTGELRRVEKMPTGSLPCSFVAACLDVERLAYTVIAAAVLAVAESVASAH